MNQNEIASLMRACGVKMLQWTGDDMPFVWVGTNSYSALYIFSDKSRLSTKLFDQFKVVKNIDYVFDAKGSEFDLSMDERDFVKSIFTAREVRR